MGNCQFRRIEHYNGGLISFLIMGGQHRKDQFFQIDLHSYKCLIRACIAFNNAIFNIFSGPLFANVEGYVYLDLMIWGLSPLVFLVIKTKLVAYLRKGKGNTRRGTLKGMVFCIFVLSLSYPFLNYSADFNWNYFSRTFNLDMGYFVFDFILRTLDLLVQVEQKDLQRIECQSFCRFQFASSIFAYFWVYLLSSIFDIDNRNNGSRIFALSCFLSFCSIVLIPVIYFCRNCENSAQIHYEQIHNQTQIEQQEDDKISSEDGGLIQDQKPSTIRKALGVVLITTSLMLNMNYFSLWMMEPMGTTSESPYQQYNITVQMVSCFFLISSMGYVLSYFLFSLGWMMGYLFKLMLSFYGIGLMACYWRYEVDYVSLLVLGFGMHQICVMEFRNQLQEIWNVGFKFSLYNEVFAYFVLPLVYTVLNIGQTSLKAYAFTSGFFMLVGAILV